MKKICVLILALLFVLSSCGEKEIKEYSIYFHPYDYVSNCEFIVSSPADLESYHDDNRINRYTEEFFKNKSLIVVIHSFPNGGDDKDIKIKKMIVKDDTLYIDLLLYDEGFTTMVIPYILYIEISKISATKLEVTKTYHEK
ncbi:MAG: hypothetical protein LBV51_01715 [Acholeplasmatales bacterium]|jgi:hypothetical protein|nr:hypothetical protein [Acholeplasmatales bacterium]